MLAASVGEAGNCTTAEAKGRTVDTFHGSIKMKLLVILDFFYTGKYFTKALDNSK